MRLNQPILLVRVLLCAASLFFLSACEMPPDVTDGVEGPAKQLYYRAETQFRNRVYAPALDLFQSYLTQYPEGPDAARAMLRVGQSYAAMRRYDEARRVLDQLFVRYRGADVVSDARLEYLKTYLAERRYREIISRADTMLRSGIAPSAAGPIYEVLGDAYLADGSPVDAVYFYGRANQTSRDKGLESQRLTQRLTKIREASRLLNPDEIMALMTRVTDETTKGYLMYHLALQNVESERYLDAVRTLRQFTEGFADHPYAPQARKLMQELETHYQTVGGAPRRIGCLLPLTGSYKIFGNRALRGIEFAIQENAASETVNLIIRDTESDPGIATTRVAELAEQEALVTIGPIATAESAAIAAQDYGMPIITLTQKANVPQLGDYVFRHFLTPEMQVRAIVSYAMNRLRIQRFAILYPEEKYGTTFMNLFWQEVSSSGGTLSAVESYGVDQKDFSGPIRALARLRRDFDAVFIPDAPQKTGLIIPQMAFYNVSNVYLLGTNLWHSDELIRMARRYVQGAVIPDVFFADSQNPAVQSFVRRFEQRYGEKPGFIEALTYDTMTMLLRMLGEYRIVSRADVRDTLINMVRFQGVTGLTSFDVDGESRKALYMISVEGEKFVELEGATYAPAAPPLTSPSTIPAGSLR